MYSHEAPLSNDPSGQAHPYPGKYNWSLAHSTHLFPLLIVPGGQMHLMYLGSQTKPFLQG
jgi:hypothetical protein